MVSAKQGIENVIVFDLSTLNNEKKPAATVTVVRGILPYFHMGDHASVCDETLATKLSPGTSIEELLVVEVDRQGLPIVSLKPLLLSAAVSKEGGGEQEAVIPEDSSELSPGDLVAGFVSRVESFGVFVKFLGRFSALCPRSMAADRRVEDPRGMFTQGDSVRYLTIPFMVVTMKTSTYVVLYPCEGETSICCITCCCTQGVILSSVGLLKSVLKRLISPFFPHN